MRVAQVGQVPEDFKHIIANDLFHDVIAFEDRLLKSNIVKTTQKGRPIAYDIQMMDLYGNILATYTCNSSNDACRLGTLTATSDGGFLFVLGFIDYAYGEDSWASDNGFASRIIKCDENGNVQFDISLDGVEGSALKCCFEKNEVFYFFGTIETPETKQRGLYSQTDIYMLVIDQSGSIVNCQSITGSDSDSLCIAEKSGDHFMLSIASQSDDGDFTGSQSQGYYEDWVFVVNDDLEIVSREIKAGRDIFDRYLGKKDGAPIYCSDPLLSGFDAGALIAFMDYEDFYLLVSTNRTGIYENMPAMISSIWYYTETVYSAYDYSGNLLFRATVDSSPDYDARIQGT